MGVEESNEHTAGSWLLIFPVHLLAIPPHFRAGTKSALFSWLLAGRSVGMGREGLGRQVQEPLLWDSGVSLSEVSSQRRRQL